MVSRVQHLYSNTPVLIPAQWPAPQLQGQECNCPAPPRLHSFTSGTDPRGHHALLVCTAENSAMPQKWYYRGLFVCCPSRCTIGRSWLRTPADTSVLAVLSSTAPTNQLKRVFQVGVRQRRCPAPSLVHHFCLGCPLHAMCCGMLCLGGRLHRGADRPEAHMYSV